MKGYFIVFEGIDGCGKSTQLELIANWLPQSGLIPNSSKLHITREPGGTKLGKKIRQLLLQTTCNQDQEPDPITELLLYAADRAQHVSQTIRPALERGDWVISDRFSASTTAYQGYGRGLSLNLIERLEKIATQGIQPDLTILLDLSVNESLKRREGQANDRIEEEGKDFLQKVSNGFESLSNRKGWIRIPAELNINLVNEQIKEKIMHNLYKVENDAQRK